MADVNPKRDGVYITFKLDPDDHDLLQNLGRGRSEVDDRYSALASLAEIVEKLVIKDVREVEKRPLRIRIPRDTENAIRQKMEETGQPYVQILLEAAREYRRRFPRQDEP